MDTQYYGCCLKYWSEQALRMIRPLVVDPFDDPLIRGQLSQKTVIFKGRIIIFKGRIIIFKGRIIIFKGRIIMFYTKTHRTVFVDRPDAIA